MKNEQIQATGANYVAAPCANCKRQLMQLMEHNKTGVKVGGVFDLFMKAIVLEKDAPKDDSESTSRPEAAPASETVSEPAKN
jgi:Fe-S oxidoreductase